MKRVVLEMLKLIIIVVKWIQKKSEIFRNLNKYKMKNIHLLSSSSHDVFGVASDDIVVGDTSPTFLNRRRH